MASFRVEESLNCSFEIKKSRCRSHSPSFFRRPSRKLCESQATADTTSSDLQSSFNFEAKATDFRRRASLYYYGILPCKKFLTSCFKRNERKAKIDSAKIKLKHRVLQKWLEYYIKQYDQLQVPTQHFQVSTQRRVIAAWRTQVKDPLQEAADSMYQVKSRQLNLGSRVLKGWRVFIEKVQ